jgi:serine/threonine protein phosphatase 1
MNRTFVFGDLHGHYNELQELMKRLINDYNIDLSKDTGVFLGDNNDGGPDTKKVIDQLIKWKKKYPHWKFLYGNHEDLLLDALNPKHPIYGDYYLWWNQGGQETTDSYVRESKLGDYERALVNAVHVIPPEHLEFMWKLDTYYEDDKYFYVHGGVHAFHTIEWCKKNWKRYDFIWERNFIKSNFQWEKKIIFGHTIQWTKNPKTHLQPWIYPNKIGLDTYAHNVGRLTAVILPEETILQTDFTWDATNWNRGII